MGLNVQEIESNSVGYKQDYQMYPLDFEEYLWAKGYTDALTFLLKRWLMGRI